MTNPVAEWLESPEGETWSRVHHHADTAGFGPTAYEIMYPGNGAFFRIKEHFTADNPSPGAEAQIQQELDDYGLRGVPPSWGMT